MKGRWLQFLFVVLSWTTHSGADESRFAVIVGNNRGDGYEVELKYAESEAEQVYRALKDVGQFPPENMLLLQGENSETIQRALIHMNDRVRAKVSGANNQTSLFVYYSGHADAEALHTAGTRMSMSALEQLVRSSAAGFRVLVVDACRSGALTRVKGGTPAPPFLIEIETSPHAEGVAFLTSSAISEDAQESDALRGSFFTHYFRTGLMGPADDDGDGRVTLDEAYRYTYANTLRATSQTSGGLQHPTYRYELKGRGKLVLSYVGASKERGRLSVPRGRDYLIFQGHSQGAIAAEVPRLAQQRSVSLPAGSYFVRARADDYLLEGTVVVQAGQAMMLSDATLHRVDFARVVRKGGAGLHLAHGPELSYELLTALPNREGLCHGGALGYAVVTPKLTVIPRLSLCQGGYDNEFIEATVRQWSLETEGHVAWDFSRLTVQLGGVVGGSLHTQRFRTSGSAPPRDSFGLHAGALLGLALDLGVGFYLFEKSFALAHFLPMEDSTSHRSSVQSAGAFRQLVGLGKYW